MDRRNIIAALAGALVAPATLATAARAAGSGTPASAPVQMQRGWDGEDRGWGRGGGGCCGRRGGWGRRGRGGPGWGRPSRPRCFVNRWGETVCRRPRYD